MNKIDFWTLEDFENSRCRVQDIGQSKLTTANASTATQTVQELLSELPPLNIAELRQAALRVARGTLGYEAFLLKYPGFCQKILIDMNKAFNIPPQSPPPMPEVPWITAQRLAYKRESPSLTLIEDAKVVEPNTEQHPTK